MKFDLHIHSKYSFDSYLEPSKIIKIAEKKSLDGVAITDHDTIKGGLEAKKLNKNEDFTVIVGSEICTDVGDIIGLFLNEEIASRNWLEVIDEIKSQGGLVILPHPYRGHKLSKALIKSVDIIEGFNARTGEIQNQKAVDLAIKNKVPIVAGSDAHFGQEIGNGITLFKDSGYIQQKSLFQPLDTEITSTPRYLLHGSQIIKSIKTRKLNTLPSNLYLLLRSILEK